MKAIKRVIIVFTLAIINCFGNVICSQNCVFYTDIKGVSRKLISVDSLCYIYTNGSFSNVKEGIFNYRNLLFDNCVSNVSPVYINENGKLCSVLNKIIIKLKSNISIKDEINKLDILEYSIEPSLPNMYIVSFSSKVDVFTISNVLSGHNGVEYCVPDFVNTIHYNSPSTINQFNVQQWGIQNNITHIDANVVPAWGITQGDSTIKVAVMDMGVYLNHPNLAGNLVPGYDATLTPDGALNGNCVFDSPHGTMCAGIIAAHPVSGNLMSGVAPNCKIMPIRISLVDATYIPDDALCRAFGYAYNNNADIISCSWESDSEILEDIISNVTTNGRNGKGIVVVASSGNDNTNVLQNPASLQGVISVGAITRGGERWISSYSNTEGSNYGSSLDMVAPGDSIYSCFYGQSNLGDRPTIYYNTVSGTSFAAPFVAGAAALLLSANKDLTLEQVTEALFTTCRKLSGFSYSNSFCAPYGSRDLNEETGYGLLDCFLAITHILPKIVGPDAVVDNIESFSIDNLPSGSSIDWWESSGGFYLNNQTNSSLLLPNAGLRENNTFPGVLHASVRLETGLMINLSKDIFYVYSGVQSSSELMQGSFTPFNGECYLEPEPYGASDYFWEIDNGWEVYSFNNNATFTNRIAFPYSGNVTVTVTYKDYTGNDSQISKLFYVGDDEFSCFSVFPNPSSSFINIASKTDEINTKAVSNTIVSWRLYNEQGILVMLNQYNEAISQAAIDVSSLREGRYVLLISNGEKWYKYKIIKSI